MEEQILSSAERKSPWIRCHLPDSIYLWACGEKSNDEDEDPQMADRLIGWLILFVQGFAYTMLIVLARTKSSFDVDSSAKKSEEYSYLLPSVTGAMYLLVASTTHDLHAGYSLHVDGSCAGHRAFGIGLLIVYGIMISAAMTVLVSTSADSASVVLNAVTVLFIADLDEKALKFLRNVPQAWRLFWAIQSIGISFTMALIAISYIGADSPLLQGRSAILAAFPSWLVWAVNPVAATVSSLILSSILQGVSEMWSEACESVDEESTFCLRVKRAIVGVLSRTKSALERFIEEPCFYAILTMWTAQSVRNWFGYNSHQGSTLAFTFGSMNPPREGSTPALTDDKLTLKFSNAVIAVGLAVKAITAFHRQNDEGARRSSPRARASSPDLKNGPRQIWGKLTGSRVPSLLVGWGLGYWVLSLLFVLACSWHGGGCGWSDAPIVVTYIGYVAIPSLMLAGIVSVADVNFLGSRFGVLVQPAVDILTDRRGVAYWVMATVLRDVLLTWMGYCYEVTRYITKRSG